MPSESGSSSRWSAPGDFVRPADSSSVKTPNPSKAPWYFLGLQEMLVYFDPWYAGVVLPSLVIFGLMALLALLLGAAVYLMVRVYNDAQRRARVDADTRIVFGFARVCRRAARFGVSPSTAFSWAVPSPIRQSSSRSPPAVMS